MKTQTHTPGPWELRHERHLGKTDHIIKIGTSAVYFQRGVGQTEAETVMNARLISAAPEMLEMLYIVLPAVEEADEFNKPTHKNGPKVRAIIAKAEGRI